MNPIPPRPSTYGIALRFSSIRGMRLFLFPLLIFLLSSCHPTVQAVPGPHDPRAVHAVHLEHPGTAPLVASLANHQDHSTQDWNQLESLSRNTIHQSFLRAAARSLTQAYPDHIAGFGKNIIYWKDGTAMNWQANISTRHFHILMSAGRLRMGTFFRKMYGETSKEVQSTFQAVRWLPTTRNEKINFSSENGAADALQTVSNTLDTLPHLHKYLAPLGGTFKWRKISGTDRMSSHSFAISIDINTKYADYWRWSKEFKEGKPIKYRNRIPMEIVDVFEANGFVWGGRWPHYDTMHFEYRPEVKLYNEWFAQSKYRPQ